MIYYIAGKFGFVGDINRLNYMDWTTDVRKAMPFSSFEEADEAAKRTYLKNHYYSILNPQEIRK